jgi:hypothetical protein
MIQLFPIISGSYFSPFETETFNLVCEGTICISKSYYYSIYIKSCQGFFDKMRQGIQEKFYSAFCVDNLKIISKKKTSLLRLVFLFYI